MASLTTNTVSAAAPRVEGAPMTSSCVTAAPLGGTAATRLSAYSSSGGASTPPPPSPPPAAGPPMASHQPQSLPLA